MSDIKLVRPHSLSMAKARALVQKAADSLAADYDLASEWHGNTLRFHRSGVDGQMHVTGSEIQLDVKLGFLLKAFKGTLLNHIERNFDELLLAQKGSFIQKKSATKSAKKTSRG